MPANYVLLERIELNASAASVTFSNIPQTGYTDLKVVMSIRGDAAQILLKIQPNGNTTGLSRRSLYTDNGTAAFSGSGSDAFGGYINSSAYTANTFASLEAYFPNYTSSTAKSYSVDVTGENNATTTIMGMVAGLDTTTSPITSLLFAPNSGNFVANSTFSLYGLAALGTTPVIAPKASGGNIIDFDGTYWIHTFLTSGTFTPSTGLSCDYLVVAGGGGGGYAAGGGGGAGGFRTATGFAVTTTPISITVGAGGAGGISSSSTIATSGSNSIFSSITSTGGGGGGNSGVLALAGGSGGGGGADGTARAGGAASPSGQGNAGGSSAAPSPYPTGGGGGASAVGANGTGSQSGAGGAGSASSISGASVTYAGGGGGASTSQGAASGAGGAGGGGAGSVGAASGTAGTINLGGGGGGASNNPNGTTQVGGAGGSGIVIIRYLAA
jgi:hypothetical protein